MTPHVTVTLLPRAENSLGSIEVWLRAAGGRCISVGFTEINIRLVWQTLPLNP
jgi:hypothetical protein